MRSFVPAHKQILFGLAFYQFSLLLLHFASIISIRELEDSPALASLPFQQMERLNTI